MTKIQLLANQIKTDNIQLSIDIETKLYEGNILALLAESKRINMKMFKFIALIQAKMEELEAKGIIQSEQTREEIIENSNSSIETEEEKEEEFDAEERAKGEL